MNEMVNLSVQELTYLTTNEIEFKNSILESNGEILSILDSYGIAYSLDILLDNNTFIYGYPYLITKDLNTKQTKLLKKNEKLLGKNFLPNNIKNLKDLENTMNFISGVSSLSKRDDPIIKDIMQNTTIDILSIIINTKKDDNKFDNQLFFLNNNIIIWMLNYWDKLSLKDKRSIRDLSPKFWTVGMIYHNEKPSNDDDRDCIIRSVTDLKSIFTMMSVKVLDYLYDLELHKINKSYVIADVLKYATDSYGTKISEKSHYAYLAKSKFSQHLDDVRFLISMRYDFFNALKKGTGIAKHINKETLKKEDSFVIFIENMNLLRGTYPLLKIWSELNSHKIDFDRVLTPKLFSALKDVYNKKEQKIEGINSFSDVLANKQSMEFCIKFLDFICDQTIKNLNESNLQDIKFSIDILSEYVKMMTNTKVMFHLNKPLDLVFSNLEKIVTVFTHIFNKEDIDLNSILSWNHNTEMRVFLCGFLNKYQFKGILPDFENIIMGSRNPLQQKDYSIGKSFESLTESEKLIVDVLLNRFKSKSKKDAKYETLQRLSHITKLEGYEDEVINLLNKEIRKDIIFIQDLTENRIVLPNYILEKLVEMYTSRATELQLLINDYLNMVNNEDSEKISNKIMVLLMGFIKESDKDNFFNKGNYREKENLIINEILNNEDSVSNIYLNEGLYLTAQAKFLSDKDYLNLLTFRNIYIKNQIFEVSEPLNKLEDEDVEKLLMNDDRFIIYLDSIKDTLNNKKDLIKFNFKSQNLLLWVCDFFKRHPEKQMSIPIELIIFNMTEKDFIKDYLIKNNSNALFSKKLAQNFGLFDFKLKEFISITKNSLESGINLNKDNLDFIKDYLDKIFKLEDFNKLLSNYKSPESYAVLVSLANTAIMSKTGFYTDDINLDKFLDGIEIILNKLDENDRFDYEKMFENSFRKVISLSPKNKEKIVLGFSELGLEVSKNTFYLADEYLKSMSSQDIGFMLKNLINSEGKNNSVLIEIYLNKQSHDDDLLFKLKNYQLQNLAKKFIENKIDMKEGNHNILFLELKSAYKGLSLFNWEMNNYDDNVKKLDILIQNLVMNKQTDLNQKKAVAIKF